MQKIKLKKLMFQNKYNKYKATWMFRQEMELKLKFQL